MTKSNWRSLLAFEAVVCIVSLFFSIVGSTSPQIVLTIPVGGLSVGSRTILLLLGSLAPAVVLLFVSEDCRSATFRLSTSVGVYITAVAIGFALPFSGYLGAIAYPLWNSTTVPTIARVFLINLFLSPLWEEIIWRAYFYPKVNSILGRAQAILVAALAWTVWHVGYLFFLYHSGIRAAILTILVVQLFFAGVIFCSVFTLSRNALGPCVVLH